MTNTGSSSPNISNSPRIRKARPSDLRDIAEISDLTWGGEDYLKDVFPFWLKEGGLYALTFGGKTVGVGKLTLFPGKVGWLEGLRIHPAYQGKGYGKMLAGYVFAQGSEMIKSRKLRHLEFSTYYMNRESIDIAGKAGFRLCETFTVIFRKRRKTVIEPERTLIPPMMFSRFGEHIPLGWHHIKNTPEGIRYLKSRIRTYIAGKSIFFDERNPKRKDRAFTLVSFRKADIIELIRSFNALCEAPGYELVIPSYLKRHIPFLIENGFFFWDKPPAENVLVFRYP